MKAETTLWIVPTILLIISIVALAFYIQTTRSYPMTWIVDDDEPANFSSIHEAINSPLVANGDTVFVRTGIYYENVVVSKSVSLVGQNPVNTIVDGGGIGDVIRITADNVVIESFTIRNGQNSGVYILSVDNCTVQNNNLTSNYYGICLRSSSNNTVSANNVTANNSIGIRLYASSNTTISANNITENRDVGIYLFGGSNACMLYHNNFIDNTQQVYFLNLANNTWNNGYAGNYWSDYNGSDVDNNGIGDIPYIINVGNQDNYPLINPYNGHNVAISNITMKRTIIGLGDSERMYVEVANTCMLFGFAFNFSVFLSPAILHLPLTSSEP